MEMERIEGSWGLKVSTVGEGFPVEELVFDNAVNGFDVAAASGSAGPALLSQLRLSLYHLRTVGAGGCNSRAAALMLC